MFADLTEKQLRRGVFTSVESLERAALTYLDTRNENAKPFVWTADADTILKRVAKNYATTSKAGHEVAGFWPSLCTNLRTRKWQFEPGNRQPLAAESCLVGHALRIFQLDTGENHRNWNDPLASQSTSKKRQPTLACLGASITPEGIGHACHRDAQAGRTRLSEH